MHHVNRMEKKISYDEIDMAKRRLRHWIVTSHYNRPCVWISGCHHSFCRIYCNFLVRSAIFGNTYLIQFVLIFSTTFFWCSLALGNIKTIMSQNYVGFHLKCLLHLSDFNETHIWLRCFNQNPQYKIPQKSEQWEQSSSTQNVGQTDMTK